MPHIYAAGDSVLATQCLELAATSAKDDHTEIPIASRGVIARTVHFGDAHYYLVDFEVGEEQVRVRVSADQIVVMHSPSVKGSAATMQHPHRLCRATHAAILLLLFAAYGLVLAMQPLFLLAATLVLGVAAYGYQMLRYREWAWVPVPFQYPVPADDEELVVDARYARCAVACDITFIVSLTMLLLFHSAYTFSDGTYGMVPYFFYLGSTAATGLGKLYTHERAARIYPKYDN